MDVKLARSVFKAKAALRSLGIHKLPMARLLRSNASAHRLTINGIRLLVPKRFYDHYVINDYEERTQETFRRLIKPGMTVVDVGAHIGYTALMFAKLVGPTGKVHAFEPSGENLFYLRKNLELNGFGNVEVHADAVGRERRQRTFHITGSSDSHGFFPHPLTETLETVDVTEVPLDEAVPGVVDAIKVDVEGAEIIVLEGMSRIIRENPQLTLWLEWAPDCMKSAGYDPAELPERLKSLGFTNIVVLDDHQKRQGTLDDFMPFIKSDGWPVGWYANLLARRA